MASRAEEATLRGRSRAGRAAASRTSTNTLTAGQRWLFVFALLTFWSIVLGIGAWLIALYAFRKMAKVDPIMTKVYSRHLRYAPFYPAQPRFTGKEAETPPSWIK